MKTFEEYQEALNLDPELQKVTKYTLPKHLYHGTGAKFDTFDVSRKQQNHLQSESLLYFTTRRSSAQNYAYIAAKNLGEEHDGYVYEVKLNIKNPLVVEAYSAVDYMDDNSSDLIREMDIYEKDAIVIESKEQTLIAVANPKLVKIINVTEL